MLFFDFDNERIRKLGLLHFARKYFVSCGKFLGNCSLPSVIFFNEIGHIHMKKCACTLELSCSLSLHLFCCLHIIASSDVEETEKLVWVEGDRLSSTVIL